MASPYIAQPDDTAGIDTFLSASAPTTNYATNNTLYIGELNNAVGNFGRSLIKFTGLSDGSIPANSVITSAILSLTIASDYADNAGTIAVYRQKKAWVEAEATWNKYNAATNWTAAGGFHADDCEQTDIGTATTTNAQVNGNVINITLSNSAIQEIVAGTWTNNGFLLKTTGEANDGYGHHSASSATASYRPKITVEYMLPSGTQVIII